MKVHHKLCVLGMNGGADDGSARLLSIGVLITEFNDFSFNHPARTTTEMLILRLLRNLDFKASQ